MKYAIGWIATAVVACVAINVSGAAAWSLIMLIPGFISMMLCVEELDASSKTTQEKEGS